MSFDVILVMNEGGMQWQEIIEKKTFHMPIHTLFLSAQKMPSCFHDFLPFHVIILIRVACKY